MYITQLAWPEQFSQFVQAYSGRDKNTLVYYY